MGDPGSEIIESVPPAGPEASESTTDENEDDIQFVSEGPLRPVLEYIDLVSSDDEEPSTSYTDENIKRKDHIDYQKDKVALTLARLARHVEVEKQQKEEKNRAFREKIDFQHAHGLQELEFIRGHSDTEAARLCVDQWLKMPGLKTGTINCGTKSSFRRGGHTWVSGKPILCPIMHCNKEFDNGHLLLGHLKRFDHSPCDPTITLHGPFFSSFACVVCYKKFVTQQQYRDHLFDKEATDDGHNNNLLPQIIQCFACPNCFLLFSRKEECSKHMSGKNHFHQSFKLGDNKGIAHPISFPSFAKKLLISLCKDVPFQVKCVACHKTLRSHMELTAHFRVHCRNAGPVAVAEKSITQVAEKFILRGYCPDCNQVFVDETSTQNHKQNSGHKVRVINSVEESVLLYCHSSEGNKDPSSDLHLLLDQSKFSSLKRTMSIKESSSLECIAIPKKKMNLKDKSHEGVACVQKEKSVVKTWFCECNQRFPSEDAVEKHVFSANTMGYKCVVCGKVCDDSGVIRLHMSRIHGGAHLNNFLFWCRTCKKELTRKDTIMAHVTEFHNGHRYFYEMDEVEGETLPSSSTTLDNLTANKPSSAITVIDHSPANSSPRGKWQCRICEDMFDSQEYVKQHCMSLASHKFHRYSCAHCRKPFHKIETLYRHCQDEHDNEIKIKYFCGLCDLIFNVEEAFLSHYEEHHSIDYVFVSEKTETSIKTEDDFPVIETSNQLTCGCRESYICKVNRKEDYSRCLQIMLDKGKLWFRCSLCSATAQNLTDMNTHIHQVHKEKSDEEEQQYVIKCGTCTKAFHDPESAQQHFHRKHCFLQKPSVAHFGSEKSNLYKFTASASHTERKLKQAINYSKSLDMEKGVENDLSYQNIGGNTNWKPPLNCKIYNYLNRIGCFFLHPRCSKRKDAADFAICMHAGRLDEQLPKQIPFTILSGDQGFLELENQFKKTQRPAHILNPHHLEGDMMCALLNSISDTTKECDSDDNMGAKNTSIGEEFISTEDVELEEAIRRSLEEM
ncbi:zinc finger protein 451 [Homo sapiens]|uniref:Isoform 2 of E3 SUMO-protein ligase ZNF451 n=1 Tax=Homo sapiens TaxID=9606 RepID=Q9Y4E5-2|nr:E3 SUMO-protein ligase ZNF451 isoform 2 [Homo sapiens]EAX04472.1 zinc finger protein 451, isoform CRA_b [Homo sapiens]KAI2542779.1 zinc finger protein 451 [Homo sapiens]KAI4018750.1 zinc finger protein 451 [Homo sapiens]|eukprot:NP_056370.2 E3 SUMO-protein ligase ZNF451 isoform 2 [Homo sapiens]